MKNKSIDDKTAYVFIILPTIMLIVGYFIYPPPYIMGEIPVFIPPLIVITLALLGSGYFLNKKIIGKQLKTLGWMLFAFYWATQPAKLYITENNDVFNARVVKIHKRDKASYSRIF